VAQAAKVAGRERLAMHPRDAAARGIAGGDLVRIFNDRGACLAGAALDDRVREGVVVIATGAWYAPDESGLDLAGNPNVLSRDVGTSRLAQGPSALTVLVEVERHRGPAPLPARQPEMTGGIGIL
jgi:biotin/methionine sulfoxide reductase